MALLTHNDYTIAWICSLPLERATAEVMLDKIHQTLPKPTTDPNAYILGNLHGHHVVIACLPMGIYGTVSAATVISHLISTFPRVQYALMVGIGGGAPNSSNNIRLGDVVVSKSVGKYSGVIQYDYGKTVQGGQFERTGMLNSPPQVLLTHMAHLQANQMTRGENAISTIVRDKLEQNSNMKNGFAPPSQDTDYLFRSSYHHFNKENDCAKCDKQQLVYRQPRENRTPHIHYGLIASGDQVMKDSETRDRLAQQLGIICFEMEAAGLMNQLPTLVIRGICDYSDSHKQKEWQGYAALTAAAYAKVLLSAVPAPLKTGSDARGVGMILFPTEPSRV
jgi:nucleoside phosphorylase